MTTTVALDQLREAVATGEDISLHDENPHWSFGYFAEGKRFWWAYECGCGLIDCNADDYAEYASIEELIDNHAMHLRDKPDYDGWQRGVAP